MARGLFFAQNRTWRRANSARESIQIIERVEPCTPVLPGRNSSKPCRQGDCTRPVLGAPPRDGAFRPAGAEGREDGSCGPCHPLSRVIGLDRDASSMHESASPYTTTTCFG